MSLLEHSCSNSSESASAPLSPPTPFEVTEWKRLAAQSHVRSTPFIVSTMGTTVFMAEMAAVNARSLRAVRGASTQAARFRAVC